MRPSVATYAPLIYGPAAPVQGSIVIGYGYRCNLASADFLPRAGGRPGTVRTHGEGFHYQSG